MENKTTILVTGGAGFIGSSLVEKLAKDKANFIVIADNLLTGSIDNIPQSPHKNILFIKANINDHSDISAIFYKYAFDYVFHIAAVVGVKRTLSNPLLVFEDLDGIKNILNLSKNMGVKRVFYSSSSEVYGEPFEMPQNERTTPLNSRLPYAIIKNQGEALMKVYLEEFGLNYTVFRFFNTYGPKQSSDFVISRFLRQALKNEDVTIYGEGSQTRTFCFIDDNVATCLKCFYENKYVNDVINIGSDVEISINELAEIIVDIVNSKSRIVHLPALKEGDMLRRKPDNSKMIEVLQRELVGLNTGLNIMLNDNRFMRIL